MVESGVWAPSTGGREGAEESEAVDQAEARGKIIPEKGRWILHTTYTIVNRFRTFDGLCPMTWHSIQNSLLPVLF
jgi:hypothetical protein